MGNKKRSTFRWTYSAVLRYVMRRKIPLQQRLLLYWILYWILGFLSRKLWLTLNKILPSVRRHENQPTILWMIQSIHTYKMTYNNVKTEKREKKAEENHWWNVNMLSLYCDAETHIHTTFEKKNRKKWNQERLGTFVIQLAFGGWRNAAKYCRKMITMFSLLLLF